MIRLALGLLLLSLTAGAAAETMYVTDELRLGVHEASDTSDQAFTFLVSGDAVEVLQREGFYARVRLEDGREGWARSTFLVSEEPAKRRLALLEAERDRLAEELSALDSGRDLQAERVAELEVEIAAERDKLAATSTELEELREEYEAATERTCPDGICGARQLGAGRHTPRPSAGPGHCLVVVRSAQPTTARGLSHLLNALLPGPAVGRKAPFFSGLLE